MSRLSQLNSDRKRKRFLETPFQNDIQNPLNDIETAMEMHSSYNVSKKDCIRVTGIGRRQLDSALKAGSAAWVEKVRHFYIQCI